VNGDAAHSGALAEIERRKEMVNVAVDAAVREEAGDVKRAPAVIEARDEIAQRAAREELARRDLAIDPHDVLVDDAAGADVEVPDLAVPHLSRREPDGLAGRVERRHRAGAREAIHHGRAREFHGIGLAFFAQTPAVENDEDRDAGRVGWHSVS